MSLSAFELIPAAVVVGNQRFLGYRAFPIKSSTIFLSDNSYHAATCQVIDRLNASLQYQSNTALAHDHSTIIYLPMSI